MKKTKKLLLTMLSLLTVGACTLGVAGCNSLLNGSGPNGSETTSGNKEENVQVSNGEWDKYLTYELNEDKQSYTVKVFDLEDIEDEDFYDDNQSIFSLEGEITIPASYNGKPVTAIGDYAFCFCVGLKTVIIPDSINKIGMGAFMYCASIESLQLPSSIIRIDDGAFAGCGMKNITLPDTITEIGDSAKRADDSVIKSKLILQRDRFPAHGLDQLTVVLILSA